MLHQTIQAVTNDIDNLAFNTAISRMMEFTNYFTTASERPREAIEKLVLLLSPFAPHIAEELWQALGHQAVASVRAVAGVRPGAGQRRHRRSAGADQRQAASEDYRRDRRR